MDYKKLLNSTEDDIIIINQIENLTASRELNSNRHNYFEVGNGSRRTRKST